MPQTSNEPSIEELVRFYREIAELERLKTGRPCKRRIANVLSCVRSVCREAGIQGADPFSALNRQSLNRYFLAAVRRGLSPLTAINGIEAVRALTARWCRDYFEDKGWRISPMSLPFVRRRIKRYTRPTAEMLVKVRDWYAALETREDKTPWMAATLMLEFGMRNGDAMHLTWQNFIVNQNRVYLSYTPNKTALSSGRIVRWPVNPLLWGRMAAMRRDGAQRVLSNGETVYRKLNSELRGLGFTGSKACYELRKICIDHVYQRYGAEMAVAISGDDIRTITRFYADPSKAVNNAVCVFDLLSEECANAIVFANNLHGHPSPTLPTTHQPLIT